MQEIKRSARSDMANDAEIVAGSSGPDRALGFLQFFPSKSRCLQFFSSFRVLLVCKVEPENHYFIFLFLAFFSFVSARPHYYPAFGTGLILHLILHFSQKVAIFAPKRAISLIFVPTLFFTRLAAFSLHTSPKISGQTSLYQPWLSPYCLF